jgi:hypothetical protein
MSSQLPQPIPYEETMLIECNRGSSEEAKIPTSTTGNSVWTNVYTDVYNLKEGDKVSMYSAFISEKGAGSVAPIEIKGKDLGKTKTLKYTELVNETVDATQLPVEVEYQEVEETVKLRDDTANIVIQYYKNTNGVGYVALPRRFSVIEYPSSTGAGVIADVFNRIEIDGGVNDTGIIPYMGNASQYIEADVYAYSYSSLYKIKNDNKRYTIFVRQEGELGDGARQSASDFDPEVASRGYTTMAPECANYFLYREKKTLTIPSGFNSPQFIADEITKQLQRNVSTKIMSYRANVNDQELQNATRDVPVSRVEESETYKAFPTASPLLFTSTEFDKAKNNTQDSSWYQNYQTIAIKRPELMETGRKINILTYETSGPPTADTVSDIDERIFGSWVHRSYFPRDKEPLELGMRYNASNLELLRDFIVAQELYPEVWDAWTQNASDTGRAPTYTLYDSTNTIDKTRWIHINSAKYGNASLIEHTDPALYPDAEELGRAVPLGNSFYRPVFGSPVNPSQFDAFRRSFLLLFKYDPSQKDNFYTPEDAEKDGKLTYGCFGAKKHTYLADGSFDYRICIYPEWTDDNLSVPGDILEPITQEITEYTKIGFDYHFTALTTCAVALYNGQAIYPNYYSYETNTLMSAPTNGSTATDNRVNYTNVNLEAPYRVRYVGADEPKFQYDGQHFLFSDLHTAENLGNDITANARIGNPSFDGNTNPGSATYTVSENTTPNDVVYRINPRADRSEYCPQLIPYDGATATSGAYPFFTYNGSSGTTEVLQSFNFNFTGYEVYDSKSGLFIEDMGYTEDTFANGLWGLCGFEYSQFNVSNPNNRLDRVNTQNKDNLRLATTNALINPSDTKTWCVNDNGVSLFSDNIPKNFLVGDYSASGVLNYHLPVYPLIVKKTTSIQLLARRFPTSMIRSYYTVRSNIVPSSLFSGGSGNSTALPIVGIVNKENPQNDFYFQTESDIQFTITKPTKLSSIQCVICDPDGSLANLGNDSSVFFKISRQLSYNPFIAEEILQEEVKNKKK